MIHPRFCPAAQVRAPLVHPTPVRALPRFLPAAQVRAPLVHPAARACPSQHGPALCVPRSSTHPPVCALPHPAPPCAFCLSCVFLGEAGVFTSFRVSRLASYLLPLPASALPPKCVPRSSTHPPVRALPQFPPPPKCVPHSSTHPPVRALPHPAPPCAFCLSCVFLGEAGVFTSFRVSRLASYLLPLPASAPPPCAFPAHPPIHPCVPFPTRPRPVRAHPRFRPAQVRAPFVHPAARACPPVHATARAFSFFCAERVTELGG